MYSDRIRACDYVVRDISIRAARAFVRYYHYSAGASKTRVYTHGLFRVGYEDDDALALGVAWWLPPTVAAARSVSVSNPNGVLSLSRLCVAPCVPKNGASLLLGRSMRLIDRKRWPHLLTYADTWRGHLGGIYRATNWSYVGETKPLPVFVNEGVVVSRKSGAKTKSNSEMRADGCVYAGSFVKHKFVHSTAAA